MGISAARTLVLGLFLLASLSASDSLTRLRYNNPGLTVDLGVGLWAWPLPMDYDGDGDLDGQSWVVVAQSDERVACGKRSEKEKTED